MSIDQFLLSADTTDLNYPEIRPTLDLNFARVKALDPRITFTRASGGSYVGADGLIKYAGVNEARFDHDPVTGESLGLLIEESRTNLLAYSDISTSWGTIGGTVSQDGQLSPDGIFQSYKYIPNTNNDFKGVTKSGILTSSGSSYTVSVFVKDGGYDNLVIFIDNVNGSGGRVGALFNLSTKQITVGGLNTSGYSYNYGIIDFNNGWYRIYITTEVNASSISLTYRFTNNLSGYVNVSGDGTSGIYIWGAQLEQASFPTSYIPTQGSTRTRAADNASITGKNFSDFYNQNEGTIYGSAKTFQGANSYIAGIWGGNTQNRIALNWNPNNRFFAASRYLTIFYGVSTPNNTALLNTFGKIAFSYKLYDNASSWNGGVVIKSNPIGFPIFSRIDIGNNNAAVGNFLNGHISRLTYFPKRLPNAQLQALTR